MKIEVVNKENKKVGTVDLPDKIFNVKWNPDLVHQVLVAYLANQRGSLANTKGRGEVRGGGKKPWAQKGTGRARHGSIRSPLWVGGGVTFGPTTERRFGKKVNKKMKQKALYSLLSKKVSDGEVRIIDDFGLSDHKTKNLNVVLGKFFDKKRKSVLLVPTKENKNARLAARNIPKIDVAFSSSLNIYDGLAHKYMVFEKEAIEQMK